VSFGHHQTCRGERLRMIRLQCCSFEMPCRDAEERVQSVRTFVGLGDMVWNLWTTEANNIQNNNGHDTVRMDSRCLPAYSHNSTREPDFINQVTNNANVIALHPSSNAPKTTTTTTQAAPTPSCPRLNITVTYIPLHSQSVNQ
jgi:hypothetical protein